MSSESERLKKLRKALDIKQGDFARKISTTQGHISDIENGRKNLSERSIKLICLEDWNGKTVNEEWLKTGKGEMFNKLNRQQEIAKLSADLFKESESFKTRLIMALSELDESEWELLEDIAKKIVKKKDQE